MSPSKIGPSKWSYVWFWQVWVKFGPIFNQIFNLKFYDCPKSAPKLCRHNSYIYLQPLANYLESLRTWNVIWSIIFVKNCEFWTWWDPADYAWPASAFCEIVKRNIVLSILSTKWSQNNTLNWIWDFHLLFSTLTWGQTNFVFSNIQFGFGSTIQYW